METLRKAITAIASQQSFSSFAVRTRRGEKKFPLNSHQVNCEIGALVQSLTQAKVNLDQPEFVFDIEILNKHIFVLGPKAKGPGGLPVGSSGRVLTLISGGIDSPVAAWRMMKRGCEVVFVHFHSAPFTDPASQEKTLEIVRHLSLGQKASGLILVPFGPIQQKLVISVPRAYRIIFYRRFMLRIASELAQKEKALALVTGEALSQVASQTLSNLATIEAVATLPVLRPLVGMDKKEIVAEAKNIGTFDISIRPHQDCCSFLMPPDPVTKTSLLQVEKIESALDVAGLVKLGVENVERVTV